MITSKYKFGDIAKLLNGRAYLMPELQNDGKYRILRVGNLSGGNEFWYYSDMELSEDKYCEKGDLLYAWACNFGPYIWHEEKVIFHYHIWKIVVNELIVDKTYLYYYLLYQTPFYLGGVNGATMVHITKYSMEQKKVEIPVSLSVQRRIASILSAYDNLIENNERRIRLLEQMAENLYKEWFVFHKIEKHCLEVRLSDIISVTRGTSYTSEEIECEDGYNLINLKNIQPYGGYRHSGTKKYNGKIKQEHVVEKNDLIMAVTDMTQDRRIVGSVALIPVINNISVISADLIKINSDFDNIFLYAMFRYGKISRFISQFANGANVLHLKPQALYNIKILLPDKNIISEFVRFVKPLVESSNKLQLQNGLLARERDLLLPRLMSGKLEVE